MDPRPIEFPFGQLHLDGKVFVVRLYEDAEFDIDVIKALMEKCIELTGGNKFCIMVDANRHAKASPETREFVARAGYNQYIIARAILTNSLAMKMASNFFIRFNKPEVETRLFTSEHDARLWLHKKIEIAGAA